MMTKSMPTARRASRKWARVGGLAAGDGWQRAIGHFPGGARSHQRPGPRHEYRRPEALPFAKIPRFATPNCIVQNPLTDRAPEAGGARRAVGLPSPPRMLSIR